MKKFLAILVTLTFIVSAVPVMAEDAEVVFEEAQVEYAPEVDDAVDAEVSDEATLYDVEHSIEAYKAVGNKTVIIKGTPNKDDPESVKEHLQKRAWYLTSSGATQPDNQMSTKLTEKRFGIQPLPLPEVPNGKLLGRYIFQFSSDSTYGTACKVLKLPGEDWDFANMRADDPAFADLLANPNNHNAGDSAILYESSPITNQYRNFVDLTSYAQECLDRGQKMMYVLFGCWNSTRNMRINITWTSSGYPTADLYQAYYYNLVSEFPFEIVDETIHGGEQAFPSDGEISWEFTNNVMDFTATVNGEDAKVSIDGTKVTLDEPLKEITAYEIKIEAKDQWDEVITKTYKFSTGFKTGATGPEIPVLGTYDTKTSVDMMGDDYALMELSFYLLTEFDDVSEALAVRDEDGNDAGVEFVYYETTQKYDISEPVTLAAGKKYEFVLKAGVSDIHGNSLEEDLVISKFYGGETPEDLTFTDEALTIGVDYENSKMTLDFVNPAYTNRPVDVAVFKNGETYYNETLITSQAGLLDTIEMDLPMGNYEVIVRPANAPDCYGDSFTFISDKDKKTLWNYIAVNGTADNISKNWEFIVYVYGFESEYIADVSDKALFANKIVELRGNGYSYSDDESVQKDNFLKMSDIIDDAAYFSVIQLSNDVDEVVNYIQKSIYELRGIDEDVMSIWEAACASEYREATVQTFIDKNINIKNSKELVAEIGAAYFGRLLLAEDVEFVESYIALAHPVLRELNDDTVKLWEKACASEYRNATVQRFIDNNVKNKEDSGEDSDTETPKVDTEVNDVKELIVAMDVALDVYRTEILFDRIAAPANQSEVEQILAVDENLELLGVADLAERYEKLNDKQSLIDEISGKEYADADSFAAAFEKALADAEAGDDNSKEEEKKPSKKPSSVGGSKGSSSTTGTQFMSSVPSSQTPFVIFTDIEDVAWAKDHIIKLYNAGVINGKTDKEFAPNDNIKREEFTKLIVSMMNFTADSKAADFADVPADSWFANYVNVAVANNVVNGVGGGLFGTGANATRQDIAVMIVNALKNKGVQITSETANFGDSYSIADYAKDAVAFLNAKGVITGDGNSNFNPTAKATRAEVAVMLSRVNDIFMKEVK